MGGGRGLQEAEEAEEGRLEKELEGRHEAESAKKRKKMK